MDKNKKSSESSTSKSPPSALAQSKTPKAATSPESVKPLAFKPYEINVLTKSDDRPSSKSSSVYSDKKLKTSAGRTPSRNTSDSPEISVVNNRGSDVSSENESKSPSDGIDRKSVSPATSQRGASPVIRSGLEVLHGHQQKDALGAYKSGFGMSSLAALCCPPGMEQHTNPAFRPPFSGGFSHHHAAMLAAAAAGYQNAGQQSGGGSAAGPYVSYARVKTPSGGEAIVPVCKDPYCTGCQYSAHNQQMMMGAPCPSGCTQCEHQKYGLAMAMSSLPAGHPYSQLGRPYICNWIAGDSYCGKRYSTSEELLQHLRTHTSSLSDPAAAAAALAQSQQQAMMHPLGSLFGASALHRAYPTPPLSPLSVARYHPYAKPGSIPTTIPSSPYATFNPAMNPYYSPYAMYGQRIGTTTVHP